MFLKRYKTHNTHIINHKDCYPIINNIIFNLPKTENLILNIKFRKIYQKFISYLIRLNKVDNE